MDKLNRIFKNSKIVKIDNTNKFVIMSDCHRGIGNNHDNFLKNKNIFNAALLNYYKNGYTYIELGDGDELWEVDNIEDIIDVHLNTFKILKKFHDDNRLIMIYGNHDDKKRDKRLLESFLYYHNDLELLKDLKVEESLVLEYKNNYIFLLHGHQVDFINSTLSGISKFLVRHVWKYAENYLLKDPTDASKNNKITKISQNILKNWSIKNNIIVITGHTHKAIFPKVGDCLHFNDGCCIHPNGITALEIENGKIALVRWSLNVREDLTIYVEREVIEDFIAIDYFFHK